MEEVNWDIEEFRQWLKAQKPDDIVGTSDDCERCPLVEWRRSFDEITSISADTVVFLSSGEERATPDWVSEFVFAIDREHADEVLDSEGMVEDYDYRQEDVTADECLSVL